MSRGNRFARRIFSFNKRNNTYVMALSSAGIITQYSNNTSQPTYNYTKYLYIV
jgi:hypothetical protein